MATGCYLYHRLEEGDLDMRTLPSPVYGVHVTLGKKSVYASVPDVTISISERRPSPELARTSLTIRRGNHAGDEGRSIPVEHLDQLLAITRLIPPESFCQETIQVADLPGWTLLFSSNITPDGGL